MPEATVAVYRGAFTFDREALDAVVVAHWPTRRYTEIRSSRRAESLVGQYEVQADNGTPLFVDVVRKGTALYLSSSDATLAAAFIAAVTTVPGFPDDGSAILAEWAPDVVPLRAYTTAREVLALIV